MVRRLAAAVAAFALVLVAAAPALALVPLNQETPIDWNDAEHQGSAEECAEVTLDPGEVLWHFVLTQQTTTDATLTVDFANNAYDVTNDPAHKISPDQEDANKYTLHWTYITDQTTLNDAFSANATTGVLNLSHICSGTPPPEIPEAPASALLLLAGSLGIFGYFVLRQRRAGTVA